jgi:hypothetical protein
MNRLEMIDSFVMIDFRSFSISIESINEYFSIQEMLIDILGQSISTTRAVQYIVYVQQYIRSNTCFIAILNREVDIVVPVRKLDRIVPSPKSHVSVITPGLTSPMNTDASNGKVSFIGQFNGFNE